MVGLNFDGLLKLLVEVDGLNAFELTEKERISVLSAQFVRLLLLQAEIVNAPLYGQPADDANEAFNRVQPFDASHYDLPRILVSKSSK